MLPEYLELPPGFNPRTLALAAEMRRDPAWPPAGRPTLVQAALERLRTGGYTYTLEPGVYGQHTADEFWFDRKEGFCEHIASAFVVLMRAMDIPARIVTGYQGGERNPRRRLLGGAAKRRPRLGRGLAGRPRLGARRPDRGRGARAAPAASSGCRRRAAWSPPRWARVSPTSRPACAPPGRR